MAQLSQKGVGYYNKEELKITKDNLLANEDNGFSSISSGIAPLFQVGVIGSGVGNAEPDLPILTQDMIERAPIQFWDNGEKSFQRYKLKVRLNLHNDKSNPEFIASLTKDIRNFRKYIPGEYRDELVAAAKQLRKTIKARYGVLPYLGKFHLNQGQTGKAHKTSNQVEPNTMCAVWYDEEDHGWSGMLMIHDWTYQFDLFDNNATKKQKEAGLKASTLFINPKYDTRVRPKTWAEQRRGL